MADERSKEKLRGSKPSQDVTAFLPASGAAVSGGLDAASVRKTMALGTMWGKYRIEAILGSGGGGAVYAGEDTLIKRPVAIKMLPPEMASDAALLARFRAEAQAAGRLNHPHVITIYEIMEVDGVYAIVMELATGGSMQDYLQRKGSPGWKASTRIAGEACKALMVAHEAGLIHRDIKPANLLLTKDGHVKVADFGLAKTESADATMKTQAGAIMGTPAFMSPEQCRGDKIDCRTDIYSLGCTYFAMLTGKPPYEAASSLQVMFSHCSAPIPNPCELKADVPEACAEVLRKALAKDPGERYGSAKEMFNDLKAILGGMTMMGGSTMVPAGVIEPEAVIVEPAPWQPVVVKRRGLSVAHKYIMGAVAAGIVGMMVVLVILLSRRGSTEGSGKEPDANVGPKKAAVETERVAQGAKPVISPAVKETPAIVPKEVAPQVVTTQNTVAGVTTAPMVAPIAMAQQPVTPAPAAPQSITPKPAAPVKPVIAAFDPERLKTLPLKITNSIHQDLILIRPGKFVMGDASLADAPPHEVTITQPYYMGICEVRQTELQAVLGASPDAPPVPKDFPAPFVTYEEAADFCRRLNDLPAEKEAHRVYRLPTEAEWEYACRAGTTTKFAFGPKLDPQRANFGKDPALASQRPAEGNGEPPPRPEPPQGPRGGRPGGPTGGGQRPEQPRVDPRSQHPMEPVGSFSPNAWGLKDMHGSVWEWCSDFYSATAYKDGSAVDPTGPATGEFHVARGGCWSSKADQCASAYRNGKLDVNQREPSFGFRVVCEVWPQ